ncbi:Acid phosphatase [Penicillium hispanicum]|uniref:Acid phosphatase n=1 Tax=Penicillium hispanicum TaxID=1080232 RepID=UPI0025413465|nr:Acid phosphatase [Penicillium hispanicum]KAJ5586951.1 Acid phosphatase [Penicillium hispanicum]
MKATLVTLLAAAAVAHAGVATTSEPAMTQIKAAQATSLPEIATSNVKGLAFDRFYQVWLENIVRDDPKQLLQSFSVLTHEQDYVDSAADPNKQWLASQGILLTNFYALAHPSEPNYCAAVGGDTFGMDNDDFNQMPANVSSIADLLDTKSISWAEYQEHIPYAGFQGYNYSNQDTYAPDYVRKHNPLVLYNSVVQNDTRARQIKSFADFESDLASKKLPQWAFITPNMTNDAHDTNITFGAKWERNWIAPLLKNDYLMNNTIILLTFDEDSTYAKNNHIFSVLVGGAIPDHLKGTRDDTFYTHYSTIATVSANWGLPSLGRWDCGANILQIVANKTGYANYDVDTTHLRLNETYPGPMSTNIYSKFSPIWPVPLTDGKCSAGHGILDIVKKTYANIPATYNYTSPYPWDAKANYNTKVTATRKSNSTATKSGSSGALTATGAAVAATIPGSTIVTSALVALFAYLI